MDGISVGLKITFKYIILIIFILITFMMIYFVNTDYNDKFDIFINGKDITSRYETEYVRYFLKRYGGSNYNRNIYDSSEFFNKIEQSNTYMLSIKEYEIYDEFGYRESYSGFYNNQELKEVYDNNKTMMVQKDGKIIYEGKFKNDITDIIKENGRYYFHVYTKQKRLFSPFAYSKTSLHFCFLVGEGYE